VSDAAVDTGVLDFSILQLPGNSSALRSTNPGNDRLLATDRAKFTGALILGVVGIYALVERMPKSTKGAVK